MENRTAFVIGDDIAICKVAMRLGAQNGFSVIPFPEPSEYISWISKGGLNHLPPRHACCIITDARSLSAKNPWHMQKEIRHIPKICIGLPETASTTMQLVTAQDGLCLEKPFTLNEMRETLTLAFSRHHQHIKSRSTENQISGLFQLLTKRELDVGSLVACGLTNQEIANGLNISIKTVKAHRAKVMMKTQSDSIADLVRNFEKYSMLAIKTSGPVST